MVGIDKQIKVKLEEEMLAYPIEKLKERIDMVAKRLLEKGIDELMREKAEELDICRRKYRGKYYAQRNGISLSDSDYILNRHNDRPLYEDDFGIITYLLTYFWRNYPMLKFILSKHVDEFPFFGKRAITVLDVGTGVGTIPLAFSHFMEEFSCITGANFDIKYYLCDKSEKMRYVSAIICSDLDIKTVSIEPENWISELVNFLHSHSFESRFDLITISYLLSELTQDDCVELLNDLVPFLAKDGRSIVIEPYSFTPTLCRITSYVAKVNTVGKNEREEANKYDFHLDMKNKGDADRIVLSGFDISKAFFCFSIIGKVETNTFEQFCKQQSYQQPSWIIFVYVLSSRKATEKYRLLCVAGKKYIGSIYVKNEAMPVVDRSLEGRVIKAIITKNNIYDSFEAFYVEIIKRKISIEQVNVYLRDADTDPTKGVIKGVIKEINDDAVFIDAETYGVFSARWGDSLKFSSPNERYRKGNEIIAFVNYSKKLEEWFVEHIEEMEDFYPKSPF
jgi:ubiquinone/menaquinone biosynthesis C-methylase UbiE